MKFVIGVTTANKLFQRSAKRQRPLKSGVHGDCVAENRGADFVMHRDSAGVAPPNWRNEVSHD